MGQQLELFPNETPSGDNVKYINRPEWCFQFFDNEPVPFAYSKQDGSMSPLTLEVHPMESDGLQFSYKGMTFKIFAREMDDETKSKIDDANQN